MRSIVRFTRRRRFAPAFALALALGVLTTLVALAATTIQISSDPFTNSDSQHKTQVEPDSYAWGNTIVAASQTGRFFDGGSSDIGWAMSSDGGATWMHDFLNCVTTKKANNCGTIKVYDRASDPSVAYDAKHNVWMIAPLVLTGNFGSGVEVSRSTDGGLTFGNPIVVNVSGDFHDKSWIACDSWSGSPHYGNCYVEWDDNSRGNLVQMQTSTDGGLTWGAPKTPSGSPSGLGGQPLAQPNGNVVVPYSLNESGNGAFTSSDGGNTWSSSVTISSVQSAFINNGLRTPPLPSAEVDGDGKVYVAWSDCRFRSGCSADDIVYSTSTDGKSWSSVQRVPFVATTSQSDLFTPGIAVDPNSHAPNVKIGVTTYGNQVAQCSSSTCKLYVGVIGSKNGGSTWTKALILAGPMTPTWLANTNQGYMFGDYISSSFLPGGKFFPLYEVAKQPGSQLDVSLYTAQGGLLFGVGQVSAAGDQPVSKSNHSLPKAPPPTQY